MKNIRLLLVAFILFILPWAAVAKEQQTTGIQAIENCKIIALTDATGKSNASTFPEINKYPECVDLFQSGPRPSRTRVFYLDHGDKKILIDSGWGLEQKEGKGDLLDLLRKMNVSPASITDILLTHMDFDHLGGLVKEQSAVFPNASLWISRPEFEAWREGKKIK